MILHYKRIKKLDCNFRLSFLLQKYKIPNQQDILYDVKMIMSIIRSDFDFVLWQQK